jgi:hypothetical protein
MVYSQLNFLCVVLCCRTEEQDIEEKKIREEIKSIDATLKKMKKSVCIEKSTIYLQAYRC